MRFRPTHVRTRLTLWNVGVVSAVLALYAAAALVFLWVNLRRESDRGLHQEFESIEDRLRANDDGSMRLEGHDDPSSRATFLEVWSSEGRLLYRSEQLGGRQLGGPPRPDMPRTLLASVDSPNGIPLRMRSGIRAVSSGKRVLIHVARSEAQLRHEWRELLGGLALGLPLALVIAGAGGYWLADRALTPLDRMARQAERITADSLQERLAIENPDDELGHLAGVFNGSLQRLEESFAQLRRFTADASHELRTPLTAIKSVGEVALQDGHDPARYREAIGSMLEEVDRMARLVESLLFLSRADAGRVLRLQHRSLLGIAQAAAGLVDVLAEEKRQKLDVTGDPTLVVNVDPLVLRQAVVNLVDNAIKFSPAGSTVRVDVVRSGGRGVVEVTDQGRGIGEAHRSRIFERFYRVDTSRSRDEGGTGLGLSIARWAVEANGGRLELESEEGRGSVFRVVLPLVEQPAPAL